MFQRIVLLAAFALLVSSCSKDGNPITPTTNTTTQPKAGSVFTYNTYNTDPVTREAIPGTKSISYLTIEQSGLTFAGRMNVSKVVGDEAGVLTTGYYNYESNGDISALSTFNGRYVGWSTQPVGSKTTLTAVLYDTTYSIGGIAIRSYSSSTSSFLGTDTMTVMGQSLNVVKIKQSISGATTIDGIGQPLIIDNYVNFAPSLGIAVRSFVEGGINPLTGQRTEGKLSVLVSYVIK